MTIATLAPRSSTHDAPAVCIESAQPQALEALLIELLPYVRGLLFRLLGPSPHLDDAVQDALIELARSLPRYEGRGTPRAFAGPLVVRVAYRYFGKRSRETLQRALVEDAHCTPDEGPEGECLRRERARQLYACLEQLPAAHRAAFVLCEVEGLTPSEAARLLRVHSITLRGHLHRARSRLRKLLSAQPELSAWLHGSARGEP
ncbi:MAG TPA: sigma-70 family RNA polymerase sigma factor [Polyangiales bacterium]|nr:sigma-70 family RNA polymerase sigma factor [Polyangiales bacterium]